MAAVEGPAHWKQFITYLQDPTADADDDSSIEDSSIVTCPNIGSNIPICCPRHGNLELDCDVESPAQFPTSWQTVCSRPCFYPLPRCGHLCKLNCHCPSTHHNLQCRELVDRFCEEHNEVELYCSDVKIGSSQSFSQALLNHPCEIKVSHHRDGCSHVIDIECHVKCDIDKGHVLEDCKETVADYLHPQCSHKTKSPKCADRQRWEESPPKCQVKVVHTRPCGCKAEMKCFDSILERMNPSKCRKEVNIGRPRCGHEVSIRCFEGTDLLEWWSEQHGESAENGDGGKCTVKYGTDYGPAENEFNWKLPECQVDCSYIAPCGHEMSTPCSSAFAFSNGNKTSPQCNHKVEFNCPFCSETVKSFCWVKEFFSNWSPWEDDDVPYKDGSSRLCLNEASILKAKLPQLPNNIVKILSNLCKSTVKVNRKCDVSHTIDLKCSTLIKVLQKKIVIPECSFSVDRQLECNHVVAVECRHRHVEPEPECNVPVDELFEYPCKIHRVAPGTCSKLRKFKENTEIKCPEHVTRSRYRCGHDVTLPCHQSHLVNQFLPCSRLENTENVVLFDGDYCETERGIDECVQLVSYRYECGHECKNVSCSDAFKWANDNEIAALCETNIETTNAICQHELSIKCSLSQKIIGWSPWNGHDPITSETISGFDESNDPIISESMDEHELKIAKLPNGITRADLECSKEILLNRSCGHTSSNVCSDAYSIQLVTVKILVYTGVIRRTVVLRERWHAQNTVLRLRMQNHANFSVQNCAQSAKSMKS